MPARKPARAGENDLLPALPSPPCTMHPHDPQEALADMRHEFGEHGGVNMSI